MKAGLNLKELEILESVLTYRVLHVCYIQTQFLKSMIKPLKMSG